MRSYIVMALLLWLQCVLLVHAQRGGVHPDPKPDTPDSPPKSPPVSPGLPASPGGDGGGIGVAGAINEGKDPQVSSNDDEIDIKDIGEKIKDLIEDISSLFDALTFTTTSISTNDSGSPFTISNTIETTQGAFPYAASGCTAAQAAYSTCSAAATTATISESNGNFTARSRNQQAGCLCNASPGIDFDQDMKDCYNWAHGQSESPDSTLFQSYASAIANATSLCAPDPCQPSGGSDPLNAIATAEACANAQPPSPTPTPSSTPPVTPPTSEGAASWDPRGSWYLLPMALWIASVGAMS